MDGFYAHGAYRDPDHRLKGARDTDEHKRALAAHTQGVLDYNLLGVPMPQVYPALLHLWMRTCGHMMGLVNYVYRAQIDDPSVLHQLLHELRIRVKILSKGTTEIVTANGSQVGPGAVQIDSLP